MSTATQEAPKVELYYEIRESEIHNKGIFAAKTIPKGTRILEYVGEKITKAESERRANEWDEHARTRGMGLVYIFELDKKYDIDGNVPYNPARLINHSCEGNCEAEVIRGKIWIVAQQDIEKGAELSYDYGYDMEHFLDHPCLCGTESCTGYIVREDQRDKVRKILRGRKPKHLGPTPS